MIISNLYTSQEENDEIINDASSPLDIITQGD
jgi:hypothetical protein